MQLTVVFLLYLVLSRDYYEYHKGHSNVQFGLFTVNEVEMLQLTTSLVMQTMHYLMHLHIGYSWVLGNIGIVK